MSGGGGGSRSDSGAGGSSSNNCEEFVKEAPLNSPNEDVISGLSIGDILSVEIYQEGSAKSLVVENDKGEIAGALTFSGYAILFKCINQGHDYIAKVTRVDDGLCEVRITSSLG